MQKFQNSALGGIQVSIEILTWKCIIFMAYGGVCVYVCIRGDTVSKVAHIMIWTQHDAVL
jgi:hypothetical protein